MRRTRSAMTAASASPRRFGFGRLGAALEGVEEVEKTLRRALLPLGGAIGELLHHRFKLGDAAQPVVFLDLHQFGGHRRHDRAQIARALRPTLRVSRLSGAKAGGERRAAVADLVLRAARRSLRGVIRILVRHRHDFPDLGCSGPLRRAAG